jgi:hypothetical protein
MDGDAPETATEATLGAKLARLRAAGFVGREVELLAFRDLLADSPDFRVLLIHGTSGVGKTLLLQAFRREAEQRGVPCASIDARDLPTEPEALARSLDVQRTVAAPNGVLLIDTFEALAGQERWLREAYLPTLPAGMRVVIAGRWEPTAAWQSDPGWSALTRAHRLLDFEPDEVRAFLDCQGLDPGLAERVHGFTRGHPLAVGMVAALLREDPDRELDLESTPELVQALVGRTLDEAPDERSRQALYAAGISRRLSEPMLAALLGIRDAHAAFEWLAGLSFMRSGRGGLWPHELVGDALRIELERREPRLHRALIRRAADYLGARFADDGSEAAIQDYLFTVRELPAMRAVFVVEQDTGLHLDRARDEELPELAAVIAHHEGRASGEWFRFWAARQPGGLRVLRDAGERIAGLVFYIDVSASRGDERADPAVACFAGYLERQAPLRGAEQAHLCRFVMAREAYQAPSTAMTQLLAHNALRAFRHPDLAIQASVRREDERARIQAHAARVPPLPGCTFSLDGADYFLMGHDWRVEPPAQWMQSVTERLLADAADTAADGGTGRVLDAEALRVAVESALRAHARGRPLADNDLARSSLVRGRTADGADPGTAIAELLAEGVRELAADAETETHARVLERTYLQPAPKQRAAAEAVGLSYGTYRRRLREATRLLAERLWRSELDTARRQRG